MNKGAIFSDNRAYRYALWRSWDDDLPEVLFIGLNPSTANETKDDPTIRRVIKFAKDWRCGSVVMMNLFGLVSSDPNLLLTHPDPIGENDLWLRYQTQRPCKVILAWGSFKQAHGRAEIVASMFENPMCLGINKEGSPKHPLYLPASTKPTQFNF